MFVFDDLAKITAEALRELFEAYGYWVVFLGTLLENTLFLGLIVPGGLVLLGAGLYANDGVLSLPIAIAVGVGGTVIGDSVSYAVGRFGWHRVIQNRSLGRWSEQLREPIMRWSSWFVLFYHFAGYSRMVGPMAAGVLRMPVRRWAPIDYAGATLWVSSHVLAGYVLGIFGVTLDPANERFRLFEWFLFALFVVWVLIVLRTSRHVFQMKPSPERGGEPAAVPVPTDDPPEERTNPDGHL